MVTVRPTHSQHAAHNLHKKTSTIRGKDGDKGIGIRGGDKGKG